MNNSGYIIRSAEFSDVSALFDLIKSFPDELISRPISDIRQNIDRFLVCEADGRIVGAISWQILPEMGADTNPAVELKSMCVSKDQHGAGVGRMIVEEAIKRVRAIHPSQIIVLTFVPEFFEKFGFKETDKTKLMHKLYLGCINCSKYDSPFTCPEVAMSLNLHAGGAQ